MNQCSENNLKIIVSKNELPSLVNYDWFNHSETLVIKEKKEKNFDMSGTYFVGILGENECTFTIIYEYSN